METQADVHSESLRDPASFWLKESHRIDWIRPPTRAFDMADEGVTWFPDGQLNTCHNAVDRHVTAGRGEEVAIYHESPVTGTSEAITYSSLLEEVELLAGLLAQRGVGHGDRVVISMPMIPQAVFAMLAVARLGAIHSVVFGGFAARELAARIRDAAPKVVLTASCGIEPKGIVEYKPLVDEALELSGHRIDACLVFQRPQHRAQLIQGRDEDWEEALREAQPAPCVAVSATDPLYILYTSGTTGRPKGVVRDSGGHAVALSWSMEHVYGVKPGDVFWAASDIGWVVGHSYIVYGPLMQGCSTVLYEGKPVGTPDAGEVFRVIKRLRVQAMFTAPTAIRAIRAADPDGKLRSPDDVASLRTLFLAGERLDIDTYEWAVKAFDRPVVDHWWQTETGWPVAASAQGLPSDPVKPGTPGKPVAGWDVCVVDDRGRIARAGEEGSVVLRLPLPPGALMTLWNDHDRFQRSYLNAFPGFYLTGDGGTIDSEGYLHVLGRIDDVINVAGHRLSTGVIEEAVARHAAVVECAVVGVHDDLKGSIPQAFVVLGAQVENDGVTRVVDEIKELVRRDVGPIAALHEVVVVPRLPKTRSGKILRATIRQVVAGDDVPVPPTIEDPGALDDLAVALLEPRGR